MHRGAVAFAGLLVTAASAQSAAPAASSSASSSPAASSAAPVDMHTITVTGRRNDGYAVDDTSSATKLNLTPRETPQSVTVITRERLDDQHLLSLRDVLDATPGIYSDAYDSERVMFYARGFMVDTLLYDGVPALPNFNTGSVDETIETAFYDRIEVVRGATGLMTGAGNPAASINLVRKHADSRTLTASLDVSLGSWRDRRVDVDASLPLSGDGRIRGRIVGLVQDRHSYQALYQKRTEALYAIIDADLTASTRVSLGIDDQSNRPRANTWGSFPLYFSDGTATDWPRSVTTAANWSRWDRKTQTVFAELRQNLVNGWSLRGTVNHRVYEEHTKLFYMSGYPDPVDGTGLVPYAYKSDSKITENALDLYACGPFDLLGRRHELVVGYNGSRAHNVATEAEPGTLADTGNFFQWDGSYPEPAFGDSTPAADIRTVQDGLYGAMRLSLADPLKLIAGARYAREKIDSFYVYDSPTNANYNFSKVIPYAGLIWDLSPQFSLFTSYTGIFKPQSSRDAGGHYLDPMVGKSIELGLKGEHFDHRLNSAFTVFETRQDNVASPALDSSGRTILLPDGTAASVAIDGTRTRGFEAELGGQPVPEVNLSLGWTRNITRDGTGATIRTFIPSTLVRLFTTWDAARFVPRLTVGGGIDWQSESSTTVGSPDGAATQRQGSLAQVTLMARYRFTPNVALQFNVDNLFDKKYYVLDEYGNSYFGSPVKATGTLRLTY